MTILEMFGPAVLATVPMLCLAVFYLGARRAASRQPVPVRVRSRRR